MNLPCHDYQVCSSNFRFISTWTMMSQPVLSWFLSGGFCLYRVFTWSLPDLTVLMVERKLCMTLNYLFIMCPDKTSMYHSGSLNILSSHGCWQWQLERPTLSLSAKNIARYDVSFYGWTHLNREYKLRPTSHYYFSMKRIQRMGNTKFRALLLL